MAKRDQLKTARNNLIEDMKAELRSLLPAVLQDTGIANEASLNAKIGHKTDHFIDLKNEVINSPEQYVILWIEGFQRNRSSPSWGSYLHDLYKQIVASNNLKQYIHIFLRRSYLKHYEELYKKRPTIEESEIWIGQNNADWGLLVAPRFSKGRWENDKSEIRHFKPRYWTIGHVLATGLVIPDRPKLHTFRSTEEYLDFFEDILVRSTASPHQREIAKRYSAFVKASDTPELIPLLIPEFRYDGRTAKHKYRLDFCIINADTMDRVGFELSPWSTHGQIAGTKAKTQKEINEEASANFEREMQKHKDFYRKHGVYALIYTDSDLANPYRIFSDITTYLGTQKTAHQLSFHFLDAFFKEEKKTGRKILI